MRYRTDYDPSGFPALELTDGRLVELRALQRPTRHPRSGCQILVSSSSDPEWRALTGIDGPPLVWNGHNDLRVMGRLWPLIHSLLDPDAPSEVEDAGDLRLGDLTPRRDWMGNVTRAEPMMTARQA